MASDGASAGGPSPSLAAVRAVHERLLHDRALQFDFSGLDRPRPFNEPGWMKALGRFLAAAFDKAFPVLKLIFEIGVVIAVALVIFLIVREIVGVRFSRGKRTGARRAPVDWRPDAWKARALLEDADRLAAAGDYDRAAHLLLYRGIEDIEGRRPRLLRPALTARDIAGLDALPAPARAAFARIVAAVEASFFGGRALGAEAFAECRRSYEAFAFPDAWS